MQKLQKTLTNRQKYVTIHYMKDCFNYKLCIDGIALQYCNSLIMEEREIHSYHEILFCENINTVLYTENQKTALRGKFLVIIPKGKYHLFDLTGVKSFARLKISISDEVIKAKPICIFSSDIHIVTPLTLGCEFLINKVLELICDASDSKDEYYAYCAVNMLIAELNESQFEVGIAGKTDYNDIVRKITEYISAHLSEDLSVKALARVSNASSSYLTHEFQKEVGISLHRYIVQKRMIYAQERINSGERASKIYVDCGYTDYSSFYKAYLNYFGEAPSKRRSARQYQTVLE